jgi:hypothetical protein
MAAGADHAVAARDMGLHERQAYAAVGAGNEYGLHLSLAFRVGASTGS